MDASYDILNPFRQNVATDPWNAETTDVQEIHRDVFDLCRQALQHVQANHCSTGVIIHGSPGSGKTHLISRINQHLSLAKNPQSQSAVFVYVRLDSSAGMLWRHVRRRFAEDLLRAVVSNQYTQLDCLLADRIPGILNKTRYTDTLNQEIDARLQQLDIDCQLGGALTEVVGHLLKRSLTREAHRWIRGESLPQAVLQKLNLGPDSEDPSDPEYQAREVVLGLCRLAGPQHPIIFCFDQVEALQTNMNDNAGVFAFGQLAATLHDQTRNTLIVSCMQSSFLDSFQAFVRGADFQRLTEFAQSALNPLDEEQARHLVQSRLQTIREPLLRAKMATDPTWPFTQHDFNQAMESLDSTPRRLLNFFANLFPERISKTIAHRPSPPLQRFLEDEWDLRFENCLHKRPGRDAEAILRAGIPLLQPALAPEWQIQPDPERNDIDLLLIPPGSTPRIAISLCFQENMIRLAGRLRRLLQTQSSPTQELLLLVQDPRNVISPNAKKTRQYLQDLAASGARSLKTSDKTLAALDCLRDLMSDAKAGDLSREGDTVPPQSVQDWIAQNTPPSLDSLWEQLTKTSPADTDTDSSPAPGLLNEIQSLLQESHILPVPTLAEKTGHDSDTIIQTLQRLPDLFGILIGPPPVAFQIVTPNREPDLALKESPPPCL